MNDIRLLATFEVESSAAAKRILNRADCARLAESLAQDLIRQIELAGRGTLVVGGGLFEPGELLQPGLQAWQALAEFADKTLKGAENDEGGQILAIGSHQGQLPDARLMPPDARLQGQLIALPLLLRCSEDTFATLAEHLEASLFEKGGLHPPSQAAFSQAAELDTGHGQLMTLNDFIALTHVQMDTAGLGAFWPVVEHALISPEQSRQFELPGPLKANWHKDLQSIKLKFETFDDFDGDIEDYALWTRAYRSLSALLGLHGVALDIETPHTLDTSRHTIIESAGNTAGGSSLTEQIHSDCGLLCWSLVDDGKLVHLYPVDGEGVALLRQDFLSRALPSHRPPHGVALSADGQALSAS